MTQSIEPPPNYRSTGGVVSLTAPVATGGITENTAMSYVVPANTLAVGTSYSLELFGRLTASATTATITWRLKIGTVILAAPAAVVIGATTVGLTYSISSMVVCTVTGTAGRFNGSTTAHHDAAAVANIHRGASPGANVTNIDTTLPQTLALTYQWSAAPPLMSVENGAISLVRL